MKMRQFEDMRLIFKFSNQLIFKLIVFAVKYFRLIPKATFTNPIITGTSTSEPITSLFQTGIGIGCYSAGNLESIFK